MLVESEASDMALGWRREMDERSTETGRKKAEEEIQCSVGEPAPQKLIQTNRKCLGNSKSIS